MHKNEEMQKTDYGKAFKIINLFEDIIFRIIFIH